jgi:chitin disaccharide deacetylase
MKRLIVNADDLGADKPRNAGIFEAIESGAVTSVSILANGMELADALARIKSLGNGAISWGIHLNLSEGKPLTPGLMRLTGPDGCFLGKKGARDLLTNKADPELAGEISTELSAQIARLLNAGIRLDHMDGHQHLHFFPAVLRMAVAEAKSAKIKWIRIADEESTPQKSSALSTAEIEEALLFSGQARSARPFVLESGLLAPDHFRGLFFKGKLPALNWLDFLEELPPGLTELMVHPGRSAEPFQGPFSGFSTADRERELEALGDGRFADAIAKAGVELTPFPEELMS